MVELETFRIGPDITRVLRNEEWKISNQQYPALACIVLQPLTLPEQKELSETALIDLFFLVEAHAGQRRKIAFDQCLWPVKEIDTSILHLHCAEKRVIVQPMRLFRAKLIELRPQSPLRRCPEIRPRPCKQPMFESDDTVEINRVFRKREPFFAILSSEQSIVDQKIRAHEQSVACERG